MGWRRQRAHIEMHRWVKFGQLGFEVVVARREDLVYRQICLLCVKPITRLPSARRSTRFQSVPLLP